MQIYINKNGQQLGPFDEAKVIEMLKTGQLSPTDFGIKKGQPDWQKLEVMFPKRQQSVNVPPLNPVLFNAPNPQFNNPISPIQQKSGSSKGLMFGLIGCGSLLIIGIIGLLGFFVISGPKTTTGLTNTDSSNTNSSPKPLPSPTFDGVKYQEMLSKNDELFKLSPPAKLVTTPIIKTPVLVIEKLDAEKDASSTILSQNSTDKYGIKSEQRPDKLDELQTLIQIKCSQGKELGKYGPRMAYVVA